MESLLASLSAGASNQTTKMVDLLAYQEANLFARREAKTRIRQRDWLKLAGEKIRREQVGSVPTFLSVRTNKFA